MGFKIREIRENQKMSQEELAKKSGVSRGTIWALETGRSKMTTTKTLVKLAKALNTSIDQIFFEDDV
jgi:transcriptional regulator with XRE-family HTH domain